MKKISNQLIDIATRDVACLPAEATISEAARVMAQRKYSCIVIIDAARHPVGIVTERDILRAMRAGSPAETPLHIGMSAPVVVMSGEQDSLEAYRICIREGIRHLVLADDDGAVIGVVSETDFRLHLNLTALAGHHLVVSVARRSVISLPPQSSLMQALNLMQAQRESCVVVVEDDKPVGIVTERDVVKFYSREPERVSVALADVMTSPVLTITNDATINQAAEQMLASKVRHLAVVDAAGRMLGLVGEHDLTQSMVNGLLNEKFEVDEMLLHAVFDTIPDLIWLKDAEGRYVSCNRRFELLYGAKEAQIIGKTDYDFVDKEQADSFREHDRKVMAADSSNVNEEWLTFAADGYRGLFETIKSPMRDNQGKLIGVLGIARDISERERSQRALLESEREFRTLAENSPDNVIRYDRHCRVSYVNPAMVRTIAPELLPIVGKLPFESNPESGQLRGLQSLVVQVMGNGERVEVEFEILHPDRSLHWHHVIFVAERDSNGEIIGALGIGRDITERKRLEVALAENELKYRTMFTSANDGFFLLDERGRFIECNPKGADMYGVTAAELIGHSPLEYAPERQPGGRVSSQIFLEKFEQVLHGASLLVEWQSLRADGTPFDVEITLNGITLGGKSCIHAVVRDVTSRKQSMQQLEEYRRRLEGLVAEESTKFRALVEQSLVGIYIIQDGMFRYVNPGMVKMFGYESADGVVDVVPLRQFIHDEDQPLVAENIRRRLDDEVGDLRYSFTAFKRDGTQIVVDVHGRKIEYQGRPAIIGTLVDITEMRRSKEELEQMVYVKSAELRQSEELLRTLIEAIPDAIEFKDGEGRWLESNSAARAAFGLDAQTSRGKSDAELAEMVDPHSGDALLQCAMTDQQAWQTGGMLRVEEIMPMPNGDKLTFDVIKVPLFHDDGSRKGLVIVGRDISELKQAEAGLRIAASVFDNTQEAITITDANNIIVDVNPAFTRITGYSRAEVLGKNPKLLSSGRQDSMFYAEMWRSLKEKRAWRGEIWNRRKSGEIYAELLSISAICDDAGEVQRHVGVFSDITYFKDHEAELSRAANYDLLTGVPNRRLLADRLRQAIVHAQRNGKMLAICYIDLDGFKSVNDQYGHGTGDLLLIDITRRLHEVLRAGDTLARLGGDEFVVLFNDLTHEVECFQVLERIMYAISAHMLIGEHQIAVSASIGVTFYPNDDEDGDTLLRHADQAMYVAKQTGKNRYHAYDIVNDQLVRSLHEFRLRIQLGFDRNEFELFYQPKLELATNTVVGVEALIRWHHPERGLLQPADFLPLIENSEIETHLGIWVLDTALAQLHAWERAGVSMEVSINIAARHLQSPDFVDELQRKMAQYPKLEHGRLQIEVLETAALEDMGQSSAVIEACRKLGVTFALDDFGTGYSSLVYLRKLSADTLKIDQSFVQDMATNEADRAIVQGVIALAKTFGRKTVAEGMEDPALLQTLTDMGCGYVQGYGIAHPMPAKDFIAWYQQRGAKF